MSETNESLHRRHLLFLAEKWSQRRVKDETWTVDKATENVLQVRGWLDGHTHLRGERLPATACCIADAGPFAGVACDTIELPANRADERASKYQLRGYASVWYTPGDEGSEYDMGGGVRERFHRGAFSRALTTGAVRCLWSHNPDFVLGSQTGGTLRLLENGHGLAVYCDPPRSSLAWGFIQNILRRDVAGMSIGFVLRDGDVDFRVEGDDLIADVRNVSELWECSAVAFPAYTSTTIEAVEVAGDRSRFEPDDDDVVEEERIEQRDDGDAEPDWDAELQWLNFLAAQGRRDLARVCNDDEWAYAVERGLLS